MARRRVKRRDEKARRHAQPPASPEPRWPAGSAAAAEPAGVVVREARSVERLAYTRTQAAEALGISRSTLRRLLPCVETIGMPWGAKLIPVDELERLVAERRQAASAQRRPAAPPGRRPGISPEVVERVRAARAAGKSLRQIADGLHADGIPTAHSGRKWWPSTIRALLSRSAA